MGYLHMCDPQYLRPSRTSDCFNGSTFEKMSVKSETILKLHYIDDINLYNAYRSLFLYQNQHFNL